MRTRHKDYGIHSSTESYIYVYMYSLLYRDRKWEGKGRPMQDSKDYNLPA